MLWGVIIGVVLGVGYILPGEYAHSILTTETDKEKPAQQLEKNSPTLLFCGEEFNEQLAAGRGNLRTIEKYNIIDFGLAENNKPEVLQNKVAEICEKQENYGEKRKGNSPIIWLKNIDKITNPELENELVKIIDPSQNTNLGKQQVEREFYEGKIKIEEIIDLSQFTLVATTSTSNPQLSKKITDKLKPIESIFNKYH
ncbi:7739_t:CDS:2 [Cetraspora pellucida]|uniref:7739_t:CDS:1 n=1 Tax=Cetraspora pellucida TaxID=1433469 RepID=A0ACA9NV41_9GLOM|nr:7739_t:CDS:2 [Cetraspora pellucida]